MKKYKFTINGQNFEVDIKNFDFDKATVEVNGTSFEVDIDREKKSVPAVVNQAPRSASPVSKPKKTVAAGSGTITSPLPGSIFKVNVKEGDTVKKGDVVMIIEAMKMENNILAETDGVVKSISAKEGDSVLQDDVLIQIG